MSENTDPQIKEEELTSLINNITEEAPSSTADTLKEAEEAIRRFNEANNTTDPQEATPKERTTIPPDMSGVPTPSSYENMNITVRDEDIKISELDKQAFLKALLHEVPIELEITLKNGVTCEFKTLNMYEHELVFQATRAFLAYNIPEPEKGMMFLNIYKMLRLAIQLISYNKKYTKKISFKQGVNSIEEDIKTLLSHLKENFLTLPDIAYTMRIRCYEIFVAKINKLEEASINGDF